MISKYKHLEQTYVYTRYIWTWDKDIDIHIVLVISVQYFFLLHSDNKWMRSLIYHTFESYYHKKIKEKNNLFGQLISGYI